MESLRNNKFYDLFTDNEGNVIDGRDIRCFLDWTPEHPELPRWAKIRKQKIVTFLDSEIHPVED